MVRSAAGFAASLLVACGGTLGGSPANALTSLPSAVASAPTLRAGASRTKIKHLVIMVQENRSFDNLFGTFPGADGATQGTTSTGAIVPLAKENLSQFNDPNHTYTAFVTSRDGGKMDGFDLTGIGTADYSYVDPTQIEPYWALAKQYVLADHMFETQAGASFTAHQDLISGSTALDATHSIVNDPSETPWGCDAPAGTVTSLLDSTGTVLYGQGPFPCLTYRTVTQLLDAKRISWKCYTPGKKSIWNAFEAIAAVRYGRQWKVNVVMPETTIFSDISDRTLPAVSWVIPAFPNSDHGGYRGAGGGPAWVASVVNAIGSSAYWSSTAIVIVWDDWGGFYDHVDPPQLDYRGLGFRVPMIVVSSYARAGYISHTQYEFGSILKFIEGNWDLGTLGTTDVRANSMRNLFDFKQGPRAFTKIPAGSYVHEVRPQAFIVPRDGD